MVRSWMKSRALLGGASLAVLSLAVAAPAMAQDNSTEVEEIVVTGFRGSLQQALEAKRESAISADAILAEDIGKFPDLNLSESIQRISGVAITREGGEGRQISVRGLGPQFTRVRIDGMEALTTSGGTDANGGVNRGRSFDFNVFASDLFNSITVQKTSAAEIEEGSLGATVDLQTARPFDYNGFKFSASAQAGWNELAEDEISPRVAAMISNTWMDDTFGALFSVAYSKRKTVEEGTSTVRWASNLLPPTAFPGQTSNPFSPGFDALPNAAGLPTTANPASDAVNRAFHPRFPRYDKYQSEQERLGATLALQWRPTEATLVTLDALYANFKGQREEQFLEAPSFSVGGACTAANILTSCGLADTNVVSSRIENGVLVAGTFNDVDLRVEDRYDELETTYTQLTLHLEHEFSDRFRVSAVAGTSKSDFDNPIQTTLTWDQYNVDGYSYDYSQGRAPLIGYGNANLTDPAAWTLTSVRLRPQTAKNTYDTASGAFEYDLVPDLLKVKGGLSWKKYKFETTELRRSNGTTANLESTLPAAVLGIPLSSYAQYATLSGKGLDAPAGTITRWVTPSVAQAVSALSIYDQTAYGGAWRLGNEPSLGNNRGVDEEDLGGFLQVDFNTELAGMPFRGNFGFRHVKTKQSASGYTFASGAPLAVTVDKEYEDTLPSMNLVLEPVENVVVRFAAAEAMTRPDLGSLTPGATVSVSGSVRSVSAGNPNLEPFKAKNFDLSFEWYYQPEALVQVAFFRKDIDSFVQSVVTNTTFTGNPFGIPDSVAVAACGAVAGCSPSASWAFTTPQNTEGGTLKGFEVAFQQPLSFLPGILSNFGVLANYTYVKSDIQYVGTVNGQTVPVATDQLTGLSKNAYNATLYYEDDKFSARVSGVYRSGYLTRVLGQEIGTDADGTNSTFNVDASFTYTLNDNFKFTIEGINLTDEFSDQYNDSRDLLQFYHHTGREILVGVRYTY